MKTICVLYNKPEDLHDESDLDTENSAIDAADVLRSEGYEVSLLGIGLDEVSKVKNIEDELVFNLVEWTGKNIAMGTQLIKILERRKIPFTGSGSWGFLLSSDKVQMKKEMKRNKIPTPGKKFPMIVKPAYEHCGIGITQNSIARSETDLRFMIHDLRIKYNQPVISEEFIEGRELHVTVLEKNGRPWVLPPAEVIFDKPGAVLSYEMKWDEKSPEYYQSHMGLAVLDSKLKIQISKLAQKCYLKLGGRDYPRLDMRVRGEEIFVLDINNNPGLDFELDSGMGISARLAGFKTYGELLKHIVENAYMRFVSQYDANFL